MKKIFVFILLFVLGFCFIACNNDTKTNEPNQEDTTDNQGKSDPDPNQGGVVNSYKVNVTDEFRILLNTFKNEYQEGETVEVKLTHFNGLIAEVLLDGKALDMHYSEEFRCDLGTFTMPNHDINIITRLNGYMHADCEVHDYDESGICRNCGQTRPLEGDRYNLTVKNLLNEDLQDLVVFVPVEGSYVAGEEISVVIRLVCDLGIYVYLNGTILALDDTINNDNIYTFNMPEADSTIVITTQAYYGVTDAKLIDLFPYLENLFSYTNTLEIRDKSFLFTTITRTKDPNEIEAFKQLLKVPVHYIGDSNTIYFKTTTRETLYYLNDQLALEIIDGVTIVIRSFETCDYFRFNYKDLSILVNGFKTYSFNLSISQIKYNGEKLTTDSSLDFEFYSTKKSTGKIDQPPIFTDIEILNDLEFVYNNNIYQIVLGNSFSDYFKDVTFDKCTDQELPYFKTLSELYFELEHPRADLTDIIKDIKEITWQETLMSDVIMPIKNPDIIRFIEGVLLGYRFEQSKEDRFIICLSDHGILATMTIDETHQIKLYCINDASIMLTYQEMTESGVYNNVGLYQCFHTYESLKVLFKLNVDDVLDDIDYNDELSLTYAEQELIIRKVVCCKANVIFPFATNSKIKGKVTSYLGTTNGYYVVTVNLSIINYDSTAQVLYFDSEINTAMYSPVNINELLFASINKEYFFVSSSEVLTLQEATDKGVNSGEVVIPTGEE